MCKTECPPKLVADFAKLRGLAKAGSMAEFKASLRKMVRCDEKCIILSIARHVVCQGVGFGIGTKDVAHLYDLDRADTVKSAHVSRLNPVCNPSRASEGLHLESNIDAVLAAGCYAGLLLLCCHAGSSI